MHVAGLSLEPLVTLRSWRRCRGDGLSPPSLSPGAAPQRGVGERPNLLPWVADSGAHLLTSPLRSITAPLGLFLPHLAS